MTFRRLLLKGVFLALLLPGSAYSLNFTPTESEWLSWPDYCRARFVASASGIGSPFERRVSAAEVSSQQRRMGEEAWYWLHHYCASIAYIDRAKREPEEGKRDFWLREADVNLFGHYRRIGRANSMFPDVVVTIAQLEVERGRNDLALKYLGEAMQAHPMASAPYAYASIIHRRAEDYDDAIEVLSAGLAAVDGNSAELQYFIGLMYLEDGQLDLASEHAVKAYELGYPLPGLAAKLRRAGRPIN